MHSNRRGARQNRAAVLKALQDCGGQASARLVAMATRIDANHAADILGRLPGVLLVSGSGVESVWRLRPPEESLEGAATFLKGISP